MKDTIKFVLFIIYTALIFCINDYKIIAIIAIINVILMIIGKIKFTEAGKALIKLVPFIILIILINIILDSIQTAILIGIRLALVCNVTYTFTKNFTPRQLSMSIENLLTPLKVFHVNTRDIGIMISIAVAFIPILKDEAEKIKYSLQSKGFNTNGINMIKNINLLLVPLIVSIFKRVDHIENGLKSKGYVSE
jgi:energy-coupling factor transporter transmembrane protein EcfT